jgi:hypothetical protein
VDLRFSKLQELKLRNWVEEVEVKQPVARGSKKVKKVQKPTKSSLRAMITGMVLWRSVSLIIYVHVIPVYILDISFIKRDYYDIQIKEEMIFFTFFHTECRVILNLCTEKITIFSVSVDMESYLDHLEL